MRRAMSKGHTASRARLIFHPDELRYNFGAEHPLQPSRIAALMDLLETCGLWSPGNDELQLPLRSATTEELSLAHSADYIAAGQGMSKRDTQAKKEQQRRSQLARTNG